MNRTCDTCRHWLEAEKDTGECRRYAPRWTDQVEYDDPPITPRDFSCGDWDSNGYVANIDGSHVNVMFYRHRRLFEDEENKLAEA
jgi:hypothetical protein